MGDAISLRFDSESMLSNKLHFINLFGGIRCRRCISASDAAASGFFFGAPERRAGLRTRTIADRACGGKHASLGAGCLLSACHADSQFGHLKAHLRILAIVQTNRRDE
jgi:hypothetical protein